MRDNLYSARQDGDEYSSRAASCARRACSCPRRCIPSSPPRCSPGSAPPSWRSSCLARPMVARAVRRRPGATRRSSASPATGTTGRRSVPAIAPATTPSRVDGLSRDTEHRGPKSERRVQPRHTKPSENPNGGRAAVLGLCYRPLLRGLPPAPRVRRSPNSGAARSLSPMRSIRFLAALAVLAGAPALAQDKGTRAQACRRCQPERPDGARQRAVRTQGPAAPLAARAIGGWRPGMHRGGHGLAARWRDLAGDAPIAKPKLGTPQARRVHAAGRQEGARDQRLAGPSRRRHVPAEGRADAHRPRSHQLGLDADVWLTPMPDRRLSRLEREEMSATKCGAVRLARR